MKKIITLAFVALVMLGCKKEDVKEPADFNIYYRFEVESYDYNKKEWVLSYNLPEKYWIEVTYTKNNGTVETKRFSGSQNISTSAYNISIEQVFFTDTKIESVNMSWKSNLEGSGQRITAYIKRFTLGPDKKTYNDGTLFIESGKYNGNGTANIKSKAF